MGRERVGETRLSTEWDCFVNTFLKKVYDIWMTTYTFKSDFFGIITVQLSWHPMFMLHLYLRCRLCSYTYLNFCVPWPEKTHV